MCLARKRSCPFERALALDRQMIYAFPYISVSVEHDPAEPVPKADDALAAVQAEPKRRPACQLSAEQDNRPDGLLGRFLFSLYLLIRISI